MCQLPTSQLFNHPDVSMARMFEGRLAVNKIFPPCLALPPADLTGYLIVVDIKEGFHSKLGSFEGSFGEPVVFSFGEENFNEVHCSIKVSLGQQEVAIAPG